MEKGACNVAAASWSAALRAALERWQNVGAANIKSGLVRRLAGIVPGGARALPKNVPPCFTTVSRNAAWPSGGE